MAKRRSPNTTLDKASYPELTDIMQTETAGILTDYVRQYVGPVDTKSTPGSGIFINWDRVGRSQTYQELAWFDLYDEVERDPHILAVSRTLKMATASLPTRVLPFDDSGKDGKVSTRSQAIADFVQDTLDGLPNFTQDKMELLDAIGKGFAISEIIWDIGTETRIKDIMNRPQRRIQFDAATRQPKLRSIDNPYMGNPLPDRKFIVHRDATKYENPFGDAIDQSVYWMWLFKKTVIKLWMAHLEVGVAPIPYIKHPRNANKQLKDEALAIAKTIRSGAYGRLPDNFELLFAEAKNAQATGAAYDVFLELCNAEITKAWLGQVLTTEGSGKGGAGSKALGEVHSDVLAVRIQYSANALACTLNSTLVPWLVDANFHDVEGYPLITFQTEDPVDRQAEATIIKTLSDAGYKADRQYIEDTIGITLAEEEEELPPVIPPQLIPGKPALGQEIQEDPIQKQQIEEVQK